MRETAVSQPKRWRNNWVYTLEPTFGAQVKERYKPVWYVAVASDYNSWLVRSRSHYNMRYQRCEPVYVMFHQGKLLLSKQCSDRRPASSPSPPFLQYLSQNNKTNAHFSYMQLLFHTEKREFANHPIKWKTTNISVCVVNKCVMSTSLLYFVHVSLSL